MLRALFPATICALIACACLRAEDAKKPDVKSDKDLASYSVGMETARRMKNVSKEFAPEINLEALAASFKEAIEGKASKLTDAELEKAQDEFRKFLVSKKLASNSKATDAKPAALENKDTVNYAIGRTMGNGLVRYSEYLDLALVDTGFTTSIKGEPVAFNPNDHREAIDNYFKKSKADYSAKNKKAGEDFLAENKKKDGVITTASGLQYKIITEGKGEKPSGNDIVTLNYEGRFVSGKVFDSSALHGKSYETPLEGVIAGWTEALKLMPVGSKWQIYVPIELAYGETGRQGSIPENSVLIFDMELVSIKKPEPIK